MARKPSSVSTKPITRPSYADSSPDPVSSRVARTRFAPPAPPEAGEDWVAVEEPLEVRVRGTPVAVLMRLPGREADLIAGFLAAEGVLVHPEDWVGAERCLNTDDGRLEDNIWNVALAEGVAFDPRERRFGAVSSSCGLCGTRTLEELERRVPPVPKPRSRLSVAFFSEAYARMRADQRVFDRTAGAHAAALHGPDGARLDLAEDVGRHNAVDKVLGARLRAGNYPSSEPHSLLVSGRISFEIVQKAALAGVGLVAGVSAPTSLAIEAAERYGVALFGLVRDGQANAYVGEVVLE